MDYSKIKANIENIRKDLNGVELLLATKTVDCDRIEYAVKECGVKYVGENRVQELLEKYDRLKNLPCEIHFIGTLQKNKVKYIIDKVSLIHSVGSVSLCDEIERQAEKHGVIMNVLCEVNIGEEENKSGFLPDEVPAAFEKMLTYSHIRPLGLMTMAPVCQNKSDYLKYFTKTYRLFVDNCIKKVDNRYKPVLSMGMSDSYREAAECGSTMVRIGSAVFGKRDKQI
ncbi:MAG: YggS family pyridoxal phosphate-dependent enzyme [Clostridia bacterium]|nr:YggS family pyridoxal phosphate-dependent enzyme [Clostridia bacterium]